MPWWGRLRQTPNPTRVNDTEVFHVVVPQPSPHAYLITVDHATNRWSSIPPIERGELPFRYRNGLRGQYILRLNGSVVITRR